MHLPNVEIDRTNVGAVENDLAANHNATNLRSWSTAIASVHLRTSLRGVDIGRKNSKGRINICGFVLFARPQHVVVYKILK